MRNIHVHWNSVINLFFPPQCVNCPRVGQLLCDYCAQQATPPQQSLCQRCGRMQDTPSATCTLCMRTDQWTLTWARAATLYTGPIQAAIHALKYNGEKELAHYLARYLVVAFQQPPWSDLETKIDLAIPVPLHTERLRERGYNQAALIAEAFSQRTKLPVETSLLLRTRHSQSQVDLQFQERQANVKGAFRATQDLSGARVVLIDDVYTTGATLNECALALREAGVIEVYGLTLAMPKG